MAIAAEALSPEAESAVASARAGEGSRLTPEVSSELKRAAVRRIARGAKTPAPPSGSGASRGSSVGRQASRAFSALPSGGHSGPTGALVRIVVAFGAGLLALELASYLSGRYFSYSVGRGVQKALPQSTPKVVIAAPSRVALALPHYGGSQTLV